jgi:hypothetical protein
MNEASNKIPKKSSISETANVAPSGSEILAADDDAEGDAGERGGGGVGSHLSANSIHLTLCEITQRYPGIATASEVAGALVRSFSRILEKLRPCQDALVPFRPETSDNL